MAKFCASCGAPLDDTLKFCTGCGTQTVAASMVMQQPQRAQPVPVKKKSTAPLVVAGVAVLVVALALMGKGGGSGPEHATRPTVGYQTGSEQGETFAPDPETSGPSISGNLVPALIGSWGYFGDKTMPKVYIFNQDGSFLYYSALWQNMLYDYTAYNFEAIYKGKYQVEGNTIIFDDVSVTRFDRRDDNENRNKIGDREHAKDMLRTTTGFEPWTLESVTFTFIESGVVRIAKSDDTDEIRSTFRADWETYERW